MAGLFHMFCFEKDRLLAKAYRQDVKISLENAVFFASWETYR